MKTEYPKSFDKWYDKNYASLSKIKTANLSHLLKEHAFAGWCAASRHVEGYIKRLDKGARVHDGHWQHEHTDWTLERLREIRKIKK